MQLVLSIGPIPDPQRIEALPANAVVVDRAPQIELLKRSALCITHGGLNTTLEDLAQGVPLVAIPVTNDQPGVAARIAPIKKTGTFVPLKQLTVPGLTLQIDDVPLSSNNPNALRWRYTFHLSSLMVFSMRRSRVSLVFAPSIA